METAKGQSAAPGAQKIIDWSYAVVAQQSRMQKREDMEANAMLIAEASGLPLNGALVRCEGTTCITSPAAV